MCVQSVLLSQARLSAQPRLYEHLQKNWHANYGIISNLDFLWKLSYLDVNDLYVGKAPDTEPTSIKLPLQARNPIIHYKDSQGRQCRENARDFYNRHVAL